MNLQDKDKTRFVVLSDFVSAQPSSAVPQELACQLLALGIAKTKCMESGRNSEEEFNAVLDDIKSRVALYGVSPKYIKQRWGALALSDYSDNNALKVTGIESFVKSKINSPLFHDLIKKNMNPRGLHLGDRMALYEKTAMKYIEKMYKGVKNEPDDIIHVTCSGYLSPNPVERFASKRKWFNTTVTSCYHMGCYGAMPAIRMAHGFMASSYLGITPPKSRIDIVHTEILSAHGNLSNDSAEHIITMTLFSDGFIRYSAFPGAEAKKRKIKGLKILALKENLLSDSLDEMTWKLGPHNFDMTLSLKVPYAIRDNVKGFVASLLNEAGIDFDREKDNMAYAIHPGGPAIVKKICGELGLTEKQVELGDKVFYENGNLSSVTIPYIFREIIDSDDIPAGTAVLSLAFGPGLTISGMVLEKV